MFMACSICKSKNHDKRTCTEQEKKEKANTIEPRVLIKILNPGDEILGITNNVILIKRKSNEVDMIPLIVDNSDLVRIDIQNVFRITYGNNEIIINSKVDSDAKSDSPFKVKTETF